jgi:hypothetical protein
MPGQDCWPIHRPDDADRCAPVSLPTECGEHGPRHDPGLVPAAITDGAEAISGITILI